jgi:hypothetical protein
VGSPLALLSSIWIGSAAVFVSIAVVVVDGEQGSSLQYLWWRTE